MKKQIILIAVFSIISLLVYKIVTSPAKPMPETFYYLSYGEDGDYHKYIKIDWTDLVNQCGKLDRSSPKICYTYYKKHFVDDLLGDPKRISRTLTVHENLNEITKTKKLEDDPLFADIRDRYRDHFGKDLKGLDAYSLLWSCKALTRWKNIPTLAASFRTHVTDVVCR